VLPKKTGQKIDPKLDPKRALYMGLRRRLRAARRFTVEEVPGTTRIAYTCMTCGTRREVQHKGLASTAFARKLATYQAQNNKNGGAPGYCEVCTQAERDRLYPLHPPAKSSKA
jgi:hypothetical protein